MRLRRPGRADGRPPRARGRRDARPVGSPHAGLHGVDRPSAPPSRDRRALRGPGGGRRAGLRRRRRGDLLPHERPGRTGRPRRGDLARLSEPVRGGSRRRRGRDPPRAARGRRLGARRRSPARVAHAGDPARRGQRPAQPDRHAAGGRRVGRADRRARGARDPPPRRRGLPLAGVRGRGPAPGRRRGLRARDLAGRDVEVVRDGRPAHRLAGDARPGRAGPLRGHEGLHDDLLVGAVRDPRADRAACPRPDPGAVARHRGGGARPARRLLRGLGRPLRVGPPRGPGPSASPA